MLNFKHIFLFVLSVALSGCGGGGGSSAMTDQASSSGCLLYTSDAADE